MKVRVKLTETGLKIFIIIYYRLVQRINRCMVNYTESLLSQVTLMWIADNFLVTERHAITRCLTVEPKRDPGQDDDQNARHVDLDEKVAPFASQIEAHLQHRVILCRYETFTQDLEDGTWCWIDIPCLRVMLRLRYGLDIKSNWDNSTPVTTWTPWPGSHTYMSSSFV